MADDWVDVKAPAATDEWRDVEQKQKPTFVGPARTMQAAPKPFTWPWAKQELTNFEEGATKSLPAIGATIGGILGGASGSAGGPGGTILGSTGGAGIGGMAGEAAKQLSRRALGFEDAPKTSGEAASAITKEGAVQGAITGLTEGMGRLAGPLRSSAVTQYERALAPTTKINKSITEDIAPEMIKRGERGSLGTLEKRATQKVSDLAPQLDQAYQQAPAVLPGAGTKVVQDLETLKQSYMPGGNVAQPQAVSAIEGVQNIVKQYGPDVDPTTLRRLRQIFEDPVAQRGGFAGTDLSTNYTLNAQKQAADSIRGLLNKNPDIGALNKEISFWLDVQRVTRESGLRRTGQEGGLMKALTPLGAGAVAAVSGARFGGVAGIEAGVGTALTTIAYQIMRSPAWRTSSAVVKDRLAGALASGSVGAVTALAARFGIATSQASSPQENQASRTPILGQPAGILGQRP